MRGWLLATVAFVGCDAGGSAVGTLDALDEGTQDVNGEDVNTNGEDVTPDDVYLYGSGEPPTLEAKLLIPGGKPTDPDAPWQGSGCEHDPPQCPAGYAAVVHPFGGSSTEQGGVYVTTPCVWICGDTDPDLEACMMMKGCKAPNTAWLELVMTRPAGSCEPWTATEPTPHCQGWRPYGGNY